MKKFIYLSFAILALSSCAKETIPTKEEDFSKLDYTNTVSFNGTALPVVGLEIQADEDGIYIMGVGGIRENETVTTEGDYKVTSADAKVCYFEIELPVWVINKVTNFKDSPEDFSCMKFYSYFGRVITYESHYASWTNSPDSGNEVESTFPVDGKIFIKEVDRVKLNNYHAETYALYIEYTDAANNTFLISYKGPNIEFDS